MRKFNYSAVYGYDANISISIWDHNGRYLTIGGLGPVVTVYPTHSYYDELFAINSNQEFAAWVQQHFDEETCTIRIKDGPVWYPQIWSKKLNQITRDGGDARNSYNYRETEETFDLGPDRDLGYGNAVGYISHGQLCAIGTHGIHNEYGKGMFAEDRSVKQAPKELVKHLVSYEVRYPSK